MNTKKINGQTLEKMFRNGLGNIKAAEQEVNDLNVFPVPDGDTGTNMKLTLENGIRNAKTTTETGLYLKQLSSGMLLGARGNSGVILSQIFKGIFMELQHAGTIVPENLLNAFIRGYKQAYASVVRPVEGTILTVAREGAENIRSQVDRSTTFETLLSMYIAEMRKSLARTPDILPVLKEAGVIDSGALGYILIAEGMLKFLYGEIIEVASESNAASAVPAQIEEELFNENSRFEDGYCTEFILQLMRGPKYDQHFKLETFIEDLQVYGNSLVAVQDGKRVKVHVHTMKPAKVITLAQEYGEFLTMKIENMQVQHNEHIRMNRKKKAEHKEMAVVAVANGSGMLEIYRNMSCDYVLDGGSTMNTSAEEFVEAFNALDADYIAVLPDNKNVILAAEQAKELYTGAAEIIVLHSRSTVEGYYAMAMDIPHAGHEERLENLKLGMSLVTTVSATYATRDYSANGIACKEGEGIALVDGELAAARKEPEKAIVSALKSMDEIYDKEVCMVFTGENVNEAMQEMLEKRITESFPNLEVSFMAGGQRIYPWLIGIV